MVCGLAKLPRYDMEVFADLGIGSANCLPIVVKYEQNSFAQCCDCVVRLGHHSNGYVVFTWIYIILLAIYLQLLDWAHDNIPARP